MKSVRLDGHQDVLPFFSALACLMQATVGSSRPHVDPSKPDFIGRSQCSKLGCQDGTFEHSLPRLEAGGVVGGDAGRSRRGGGWAGPWPHQRGSVLFPFLAAPNNNIFPIIPVPT